MPKKKLRMDVKAPAGSVTIPPELLDRIVTGPMTRGCLEFCV